MGYQAGTMGVQLCNFLLPTCGPLLFNSNSQGLPLSSGNGFYPGPPQESSYSICFLSLLLLPCPSTLHNFHPPSSIEDKIQLGQGLRMIRSLGFLFRSKVPNWDFEYLNKSWPRQWIQDTEIPIDAISLHLTKAFPNQLFISL
jgi:hypothetical protein